MDSFRAFLLPFLFLIDLLKLTVQQPLEHPAITHYQHIFSWQVELGYNKHYSKHDKLSFSLACLLVCFIFNQIWKPGFRELFKKLDMVSLARCRPTGIARVSLLFWIPSVLLICTLLLSLLYAASYPLCTIWPWSFPPQFAPLSSSSHPLPLASLITQSPGFHPTALFFISFLYRTPNIRMLQGSVLGLLTLHLLLRQTLSFWWPQFFI